MLVAEPPSTPSCVLGTKKNNLNSGLIKEPGGGALSTSTERRKNHMYRCLNIALSLTIFAAALSADDKGAPCALKFLNGDIRIPIQKQSRC
jgi:hypothetical protein